VDLSILRVAIYEMLYRKEDVPTGAAINEAVELPSDTAAKRSYAFVNGILGSVAKEIVSP
jgi:N utilization substance protein B